MPPAQYGNAESLFRAVHADLARAAYGLLGHHADAEDAVQNSFYQLMVAWHRVGKLATPGEQRVPDQDRAQRSAPDPAVPAPPVGASGRGRGECRDRAGVGAGPATEPFRTLRRFGEVRTAGLRGSLAYIPVPAQPGCDLDAGLDRLAGWRWVTVIFVSGSPRNGQDQIAGSSAGESDRYVTVRSLTGRVAVVRPYGAVRAGGVPQ
jgi:Sigma-70 region 2